MQKYQSHKIVEAGRITDFIPRVQGGYSITVEGDPMVVGLEQEVGDRILSMAAEAGQPVNGGWLVQYGDDYVSWSPAKAFEEGYELLQPSSGKSKIAGYRTLSEEEIEDVNKVKRIGVELGVFVEGMADCPEYDGRWISIGRTHLQQGLMALTRAITKPEFF